jgi:hypothetical protein
MVRYKVREELSRLGFKFPEKLSSPHTTFAKSTPEILSFLTEIDEIKAEYGAFRRNKSRGWEQLGIRASQLFDKHGPELWPDGPVPSWLKSSHDKQVYPKRLFFSDRKNRTV